MIDLTKNKKLNNLIEHYIKKMDRKTLELLVLAIIQEFPIIKKQIAIIINEYLGRKGKENE